MDQKSLRRLVELIRELSYREGEFTLSSGKKSNFYIDLKTTTLHPEGAFQIGEMATELISSHVMKKEFQVHGVGGLTLGADPIATAISLGAHQKGLFWPAFIVRKEPKSHGTSRYIEGVENLPRAASLIVVEDVVTTGASSLKAAQRLREAGFNPVATLTVVDRQEGGREVIEAAGMKFFSLTTLQMIKNL